MTNERGREEGQFLAVRTLKRVELLSSSQVKASSLRRFHTFKAFSSSSSSSSSTQVIDPAMAVLQPGPVSGFLRPSPPFRRERTSSRGRRVFCLQQQVPTTTAAPTRTQRIMESISVSGEVGGAGGAYSYGALKRLDRVWSSICSAERVAQEPQEVVTRTQGLLSKSDLAGKAIDTFDVLVCGGTLGIFIATALSCKGLRVGVVERNILKGREQEWNISKKELLELVEVGVLAEEDIDRAVAAKFNPNRCGFEGKGEIWVEDILNLADGNVLASRLVIDATGNFSPIVKQIRGGMKPDGVCLVVGSCARGFSNNSTSDVIYSSSSVKQVGESKVQLFWEAFPAGSGPEDRTTYMFSYVDPQPRCPKLEELLEAYWDLMPKYQPNLSASWLFQRAMSAKQRTSVSSDFINELLSINFQCMQKLGDPVLRPFLQDVIQFWPLTKTLGLVMITKPQILPSIFNQVGIPVLLDWSRHFFMLGSYTFLSTFIDPLIRPMVNSFPPKTKYEWKRNLEAWKYGAGLDYEL
ncbi:hypothetical protein CDL15_Pgr023211 [Punica granatum]|uniref:Uncharacterized protein n=1 Tax=Punica granatum TaxID=22663 RepID=A0A218X4Z0_PUNGR|nr:hypothetical protein CDL15_Pgr023211 [Punica granatum]